MASRGLLLCLLGGASALQPQATSSRLSTRLSAVSESVVAAHEDDAEGNMDDAYTTQIFCNRELNMQQIEAVGCAGTAARRMADQSMFYCPGLTWTTRWRGTRWISTS
jgi:hypothetical protein